MIWPLTAAGGASTGGSSWRPSGGSNLEMLSDAVMMDIYVIYIYMVSCRSPLTSTGNGLNKDQSWSHQLKKKVMNP